MLAELAVNDAGRVHRRWSSSPGRTCPPSRASTPPATPPDRPDIAAGELHAPRRDTVLTNARSERVRRCAACPGGSLRQRARPLPRRGTAGRPRGPGRARPPGRGRPPALVHEVFADAEAAERYADLLARRGRRRRRGHLGRDRRAGGAVRHRAPAGLVAVCDLVDVPLGRRPAAVGGPRPALVAVLARVRDPGNAGTVIRAADAAGADAVVLTDESVDVHNPKCVRASAGSLFHLPVAVGAPLAEAGRRAASARAASSSRPTAVPRPSTWTTARRRGPRCGTTRRADGLDLRQRGVGALRAELRAGRPRRARPDPRPRREPEPGDGRGRLPLRLRAGAPCGVTADGGLADEPRERDSRPGGCTGAARGSG